MNAVLYIHGKGGSAAEAAHYRPLFPGAAVAGLDYQTFTPWQTGPEIRAAATDLKARYDSVTLVANSIGAYFSMHADLNGLLERAFFISPIVDMERLIAGMMARANVTEAELAERGEVRTDFGETLSWDYLCYVRGHPIDWTVPTQILCGSRDELSPIDAVRAFAGKHGASLTVMDGGEHWFHTPEQMDFLDGWLRACEKMPAVGRKQ